MKKHYGLLTILSIISISACAADAPRKPETAKEFEARYNAADTDKSGGLSKQEVERAAVPGFPVILKNFDAMDVNKDGQVTLLERNVALGNAARAQRAQAVKRIQDERKDWESRFNKADTNKDGGLSKKEAESASKPGFPQITKNFTAMDKDKNGRVTINERDAYLRDEVRKQMGERQKQARKAFEDRYAKADSNRSGGLSKREVDSAASPGFPFIKNNFNELDANKDGQVTIKELEDFQKKGR